MFTLPCSEHYVIYSPRESYLSLVLEKIYCPDAWAQLLKVTKDREAARSKCAKPPPLGNLAKAKPRLSRMKVNGAKSYTSHSRNNSKSENLSFPMLYLFWGKSVLFDSHPTFVMWSPIWVTVSLWTHSSLQPIQTIATIIEWVRM